MHCQQRLVAYFYALWGAFTNGSQNTLNMHQRFNASKTAVDLPLDGLGDVEVSEIRRPDGTACSISLNCPLGWDNSGGNCQSKENGHMNHQVPKSETGFNLTLTLTSFDWRTSDLQECRDKLDDLLFRGQEETPPKPLDLTRYFSLLKQTGKERGKHDQKPDQRNLQRRYPLPASNNQHEDKHDSRTPTSSHSWLLDHFLSWISQRRAVHAPTNNFTREKPGFRGTLKRMQFPSLPVHLPRRLQKATPSKPINHRSACEQNFCQGYNLEKICGKLKKPNTKLETENLCKLCYPKKNSVLIKEHCEERERREIQALHMLCVALGVSVAVAALLYLIRVVCRPLRKRCQLLWRLRTGRISTSPSIVGRLSSIFSMNSGSGFTPAHLFDSETDSAQNECNTERPATTSSAFQQKVNQFLAKEPRGRIKDVFDLESLPPSHAKEEGFSESIPVLTRASNASIRRHWGDGVSGSDSSDGSNNALDIADMPPRYTP
ncbi:hypothetical protein PHISP_05191 [Aspergillus sp. HF37]|nr:hypothetical protein PHISP_05191 [Aspergillus sp. HF37]